MAVARTRTLGRKLSPEQRGVKPNAAPLRMGVGLTETFSPVLFPPFGGSYRKNAKRAHAGQLISFRLLGLLLRRGTLRQQGQ